MLPLRSAHGRVEERQIHGGEVVAQTVACHGDEIVRPARAPPVTRGHSADPGTCPCRCGCLPSSDLRPGPASASVISPWGRTCSSRALWPARLRSDFAVSTWPEIKRRTRPGSPSSSTVPGALPLPPWPPTAIQVRSRGRPQARNRFRSARNSTVQRALPAMPQEMPTAPSGTRATASSALMNRRSRSGSGGQ